MKWVSVGPVSVPTSWAAIVSAFLITGAYLFITKKKAASDWYGNAIFTFIVTWKLSVILFYLKMTLANPLNILYFNGGVKGYGLGILGALLYTVLSKRRSVIGFSEAMLSWIITVSVYELVYGILNEEAIIMIIIQFLVNLVLVVLNIIKTPDRKWLMQIMVLFTSMQGLFYTLKADLFSLPMATYGLLAIFFYFWRKRGDDQ